MLSFETTDSWGWTFDLTVGLDTNTFTNTATSAYASIVALTAWANDTARPWYPTSTFSWGWLRDEVTGGAYLYFESNHLFKNSGGASSTLKFLAQTSGSSVISGTTSAVGTWAPKSGLSVYDNYRFLSENGDASATGAVRPGLQATSAYRPKVEAAGTSQDAARMTYILGRTSNPRRAWAYRKDAKTWQRFAIGTVERNRLDGVLYAFEIEAGGPTV